MKQREFDTEIKRLERRLRLLLAVDTGKVNMRKITVHRHKMRWEVHAKSRTYVRYIAPKGWK